MRDGETPEQTVTFLYNAILRRAPDVGGLTFYAGELRQGSMDERDIIKALVDAPEYSAKRLIRPETITSIDGYDLSTDERVVRFLSEEVRSLSVELQNRSLDRGRFDEIARSVSERFPQPDYLEFHKERFYELDCIVANLMTREALCETLEVGLCINTYMMLELFPSLQISLADRPQTLVPNDLFRKAFLIDLEDDELEARSLGAKFDLITFCEVIEHLRMHPAEVLKFLLAQLSPRGLIVMTTPNVYSRAKLGLINQRQGPLPPLIHPLILTPQYPLEKGLFWTQLLRISPATA